MVGKRTWKFLRRGTATAVLAAALGVSALVVTGIDTSAIAKPHGAPRASHAGPHFVGHGAPRGGVHVGRHFYHGHWWAPGVGPCWRLTPLGWIWICG